MNRCGKVIKNPTVISCQVEGVEGLLPSFSFLIIVILYYLYQAFHAYKAVKEQHAKVLANKWKDKIEPRAYDALMNYQVEITD